MRRYCFLSAPILLCAAVCDAVGAEISESLLSGCQASNYELVGQAYLGEHSGNVFGAREYLTEDALYLCFTSRAGHEEGFIGHLKLVVKSNETLIFGTCFVDGVNDLSVFAVAAMSEDAGFVDVKKGWRFDPNGMAVQRIPLERLKCSDF